LLKTRKEILSQNFLKTKKNFSVEKKKPTKCLRKNKARHLSKKKKHLILYMNGLSYKTLLDRKEFQRKIVLYISHENKKRVVGGGIVVISCE